MINAIKTPDGVTYHGWQSDGHGVGYRAVHHDGRTEYVYVKPAANDQGVPVVRVYVDTTGDATSEPTEYEAFPDGASSMTGIKVSDRVLLGAIEIAGVLFLRFTDGYAIGWEMVNTNVAGGSTTCFYLNPSGDTDDGQPNVFAYHGPHGSPALDSSVAYFDVFRPDESEVEDMGTRKLFKTTVVIWSTTDPSRMDVSDLARDADTGMSYCSYQEITEMLAADALRDEQADDGMADFFGIEVTDAPAQTENPNFEHLNCPSDAHDSKPSDERGDGDQETTEDGRLACNTCLTALFFCEVVDKQGDWPYAHVYQKDEKACPSTR